MLRLQLEVGVLTHELAKDLVRLRGLEPAVEIDRGLNATMAQDAPRHLVVSRISLEDDGPSSVAELMNVHPNPGRLENALFDLGTE